MSHVVRPEILILPTRFISYWQGHKLSIQIKAIQQRKRARERERKGEKKRERENI